MNCSTRTMETMIPNGRTLHVDGCQDLELQVVTGQLWVTCEGSPADVVLEPCESFRVTRGGLTLAHAFRDVRLRIAYPADALAPRLAPGGGPREFGASVLSEMLAQWIHAVRARFASAPRAARPVTAGAL
jgi:hypothetical protein